MGSTRYARCLVQVRRRARGIATAREYQAVDVSEDETVARDVKIPFGQHKGQTMGSLPQGYLRVLARMAGSNWASLAEEVLDERGSGSGGKKSFSAVMEQEAYLRLLNNATNLEAVKLVHSRISDSEHRHNVSLSNKLMESYGKFGSVEDAEHVFKNMLYQNEDSWNLIISAYARNGQLSQVRAAFNSAPARGITTWTMLLESYADGGLWDDAVSVFEKMTMRDLLSATLTMNVYVRKEISCAGAKALFDTMLERDVSVYSSMMQAFVQDGRIDKAKETLDKMAEWDVIAVNCMLQAFADQGYIEEAKQLFNEFPERDETSMVLMIRALGLSGQAEDAKRLFDRMFRKDEELWIVLIRAYSLVGHTEEAKKLFDQVPVKTESSWAILTECYSHNFQLENAELVFDQAPKWSIRCWIALISAYSRYGDEQMARLMFNRISDWDAGVWKALIAELVASGRGRDALLLLQDMSLQGFSPDGQTFINLLNACTAHQQGRHLFTSMVADFGLAPWIEHFCALVRVLGRAQRVELAIKVVEEMPFKPDYLTRRALFDACWHKNDVKHGLRVGKELMRMDPWNPWTYSLVAEFCAVQGRQDKAVVVKRLMKKQQKLAADEHKQQHKCASWVVVKNRLHKFRAGDTGHPESGEIERQLKQSMREIEKLGYKVNTSVVVDDEVNQLSEEEKREIVCDHGEKLAVAYGLMNSSNRRGDPVRMMSNWRVCDDCHEALKFISKLKSKLIVLRDDRWFHHFRNGQCSCKDYW